MSLQTYQKKRRFSETPEPRGRTAKKAGALRFVVQKHDASRLHYDFRLELDGVMKSWAVPKGPSLNPDDKRLAIMVEDHPLDYRTFEGTIPAGNYGAGTVIVWDEGTYHSGEDGDAKTDQESLRAGLEKGHLSFVLDGKKLQGGFSLLKLRRGKQNEWLLIKKQDEYSNDADVLNEDRSVRSGRNLREVGESPKAVWKSNRDSKENARSASKKSAPPGSNGKHFIKPMLATLVDEPFDRKDWLFEIKWDGYRAIAELNHGKVRLYSRNGISFADRFKPIFEELAKMDDKAVLDGEIVVVDEQGRSRFQLLQNYQKTGKGNLRYYVFDLLSQDGKDLRKAPLRDRRQQLKNLLDKSNLVIFSEDIEEEGKAFFEAATAKGLEGIVAKKASSTYKEGHRGPEWLKIKTHNRQEAVIGGFTEPRGSRKDLGTLVLGVYEGDELVFIGHGGGGIGTKGLADLRKRLEHLEQKTCPFRDKPQTNAPVHWVAPKLVCEVSFQEWTDDGRMRAPIYHGLREDKDAHTVRREVEHSASAEEQKADQGKARKSSKTGRCAAPASRSSEVKKTKSSHAKQSANMNEPALTNLHKVYWPDEGYTKGDMIAYYREMASTILPYLHDRPESLNRHPNGIKGKNFFQKNVSKQPPPEWVKTVSIEGSTGQIEYIVCQDEATLLYLANLGCIEINPWNSRIGHLDQPDYFILDLDPEDILFEEVIRTAQTVHTILEKAGAESFCKTTGKRGLHIFVPIGAKYTYDAARQFAHIVASLVNEQLPETTSLLRSPSKRQHRVYVDYMQNSRGQTLAAPYSIRPAPGATVSTPLAWREVKQGLDPKSFTIKTVPKRVAKVGDLWKPVLGAGINLEDCLAKLQK